MAAALRSMRWMLPASRIERRWWTAVSVTAGITEEIVARGCLPSDLHGASGASPLPHLPYRPDEDCPEEAARLVAGCAGAA